MKPRVLVAGLFHESHSFVPGLTRLGDCATLVGEQLWTAEGNLSPLGGALETARELGWQVVLAIDVRAMPGAPVASEVVEFWWREIEKALAASGELDGIFLILHGAMLSQNSLDVEGDVLERLRFLAPNVPIGGVTDLHANFSPKMARHSDALVTYRKNPHTDAAQIAQHSAWLFDGLLRSGQRAQTILAAPPLVLPPTSTGTCDLPMQLLETMARDIEAANDEILAVNVHAGYAFADTPQAGVSFSIVTTGDAETARELLQPLMREAWRQKERALPAEMPLQDALLKVRAELQNGSSPVLLVEPADNIGGGAPGNATHILRALLNLNFHFGTAGVILDDAQSVQLLASKPIGSVQTLAVGGKSGALSGGPVEVEAELLHRSDGRFELEDAHSHLASMGGSHVEMGPCALLKCRAAMGEIVILLTSRKTPPFDLGQWRSQGVAPETLNIIGVKAAVAHRQAYDPIARAAFWVSTSGPCASDLRLLPFRHLRRPIFPLDENYAFEIETA